MTNNKLLAIVSLSFFLGLIYLFFPTNNSTVDAYSYAADIRFDIELFNPHHLLYNASGAFINFIVRDILKVPIEILSLMKAVNAVFAFLSLIVLGLILKSMQVSTRLIISLILLAGSAFGVMRFATENETYIIPVFFSLWGTYFWLNYQTNKKQIDLLLSGFMLAIACLFHQIHFFWWLAIGMSLIFYSKKRLAFSQYALYFLPAMLVPLTYLIVLCGIPEKVSFQSYLEFVFREFYKGNVETSFSFNNIILTGINMIRTWVQIHGNVVGIMKSFPIYILPAVASSLIILFGLFRLKTLNLKLENKRVFFPVLTAFVLQTLFALYAVGNSEFMVMLPFLFGIMVASFKNKEYRPFLYLGIGILTWNLSVSIIPSHLYQLSGDSQFRVYIENHPKEIFLVKNKVQIETEFLYYQNTIPDNVIPSPEYYMGKDGNLDRFNKKMNDAFNSGSPVITDMYGNASFMSRGEFLSGDINDNAIRSYKKELADSITYDLGKVKLYKITK